MRLEDLSVVGNGRIAALIDADARIVWWCWPDLDGDPVFCALLDGDRGRGAFGVALADQAEARVVSDRTTGCSRRGSPIGAGQWRRSSISRLWGKSPSLS